MCLYMLSLKLLSYVTIQKLVSFIHVKGGGEFTTTYTISAYHHWCCEFKSRSGRGVQNYVIKIVSDLRQVSGFLRVLRFSPPIKLLKVALKTIKQTKIVFKFYHFYLFLVISHGISEITRLVRENADWRRGWFT
jgi:hypothetical protein